jgi:hypothetical protein
MVSIEKRLQKQTIKKECLVITVTHKCGLRSLPQPLKQQVDSKRFNQVQGQGVSQGSDTVTFNPRRQRSELKAARA